MPQNLRPIIGIVIAVALLSVIQQESHNHYPDTTPTMRATIAAPTGYDEWLRSTVEKKTGARSSLGVARVWAITFDGGEAFPVLALVADDNSTLKLVRLGMLFDASKLFPAIFADGRASVAMIVWMRPITDKYGNTSMEAVMAIRMSRATEARVNWKGFSYENLPSVADDFVERPMMEW